MFGSFLSMTITVARIVVALSVLVSAQAQAQSFVGTWATQGSDWVFFIDSSGRAVVVGTGVKESCAAVSTVTTTVSASASSLGFVSDPNYACGGNSLTQTSPGTLTAEYVLSGNTLTLNNIVGGNRGITTLALTSVPVQTGSFVGTWAGRGIDWVWNFQANGQFVVTGTGITPNAAPNCAGTGSMHGTYSASAGTLSFLTDSATCNGISVPNTGDAGTGRYAFTGNTLTFYFQKTGGSNAGATFGFILTPQSGSTPPPTPTPTTPLPPPPTVQTVFTAPSGALPPAAVQVSATGTYGNASLSVTLDIVQALQAVSATGFASSPYNVYVVALVPGAALGLASPVIFIKSAAGWGPLQFPVAAYLTNVAAFAVNNQVIIDILANNDISSLVGTEIYIGYGLSDTEMLAAGRYRGVYRVQ
jgi:hypothetical protein